MALPNKALFGRPIEYVSGPGPNPRQGQMYVEPLTFRSMMFDGTQWVELALDPNSMEMMSWQEEVAYEALIEAELCAQHPGLKELKDQLDEAREKFEAYKALVKE